MACPKCQHIANEIQCQECADDIFNSCDNDNCEADELITYGSINGHPISPYITN